MKAIGVTNRVDQLGKVILPKKLRSALDIKIGDPVEIYLDGDLLYMKKYFPECVFCESIENVIEYNKIYICKKCLEALKKL